jgi:hypothetical protein
MRKGRECIIENVSTRVRQISQAIKFAVKEVRNALHHSGSVNTIVRTRLKHLRSKISELILDLLFIVVRLALGIRSSHSVRLLSLIPMFLS